MKIKEISEPSREEVNQFTGAVMLAFGAQWCGHCKAAQGITLSSLALYPNVRHINIEDGKGRVLGRSFAVKLWPTLIFMREGIELKRLVRQFDAEEIVSALDIITD